MAARYDRHTSRVVVKLNTDVQISFPPRLAEGLADASPDDLATIEISLSGLVPTCRSSMRTSTCPAYWPKLGAAGGSVCSPAKALSSRENGREGARPHEVAKGRRQADDRPRTRMPAASAICRRLRMPKLSGKKYFDTLLSQALPKTVAALRPFEKLISP